MHKRVSKKPIRYDKKLLKVANKLCDNINQLMGYDIAYKNMFDNAAKLGIKLPACLKTIKSFKSRPSLELFRHYLCKKYASLVNHVYTDLNTVSDRMISYSGIYQARYCPNEIYRDLIALRNEFDDFHIGADEVSVYTKPVIFEYDESTINLGRFQLTFPYSPYLIDGLNIDAVEPSYPHWRDGELDEGTIHPHVRDDDICWGAAYYPISTAQASGRLYDMFMIANSFIHTYNDSDCYTRLSRWIHPPCPDCGRDDYLESCCYLCDRVMCDLCLYECGKCSELMCNECLYSCRLCELYYCKKCLITVRVGKYDYYECDRCYIERKQKEKEEANSNG